MDDELDVYDETECRALLRLQKVGRVAVAIGGRPTVFPAAFQLVGDAILIRVARGTTLAAALDDRHVAFEVDGFDEFHQEGWTVLVQGWATIAPTDEYPHLRVRSWLPGRGDVWALITTTWITGRRIRDTTAVGDWAIPATEEDRAGEAPHLTRLRDEDDPAG